MIVAKYFPKKSIDEAKKAAKFARSKVSGKKKNQSDLLDAFIDHFIEERSLKRTFRASIESKKLFRWPHELKGKFTTDELQTYLFLGLSYLGLKPKIYEAINCVAKNSAKYGTHLMESVIFTTFDQEKKTVGYHFNGSACNEVTVTKDRIVYKAKGDLESIIDAQKITELSAKDIAKRIRKSSSLEGKMKEVSRTQTLQLDYSGSLYLTAVGKYDVDKNEILFTELFTRKKISSVRPVEKTEIRYKLDKKGDVESIKLSEHMFFKGDWFKIFESDLDKLRLLYDKFKVDKKLLKKHSYDKDTVYSRLMRKGPHYKKFAKEMGLSMKYVDDLRNKSKVMTKEHFKENKKRYLQNREVVLWLAQNALQQKLHQGIKKEGYDYSIEELDKYAMDYLNKYARKCYESKIRGIFRVIRKAQVKRKKYIFKFIGDDETAQKGMKDFRTANYYEHKLEDIGWGVKNAEYRYSRINTLMQKAKVRKVFSGMDVKEILAKLKLEKLTLLDGYNDQMISSMHTLIDNHKFDKLNQELKRYQKIIKPYLRQKWKA